MELCLMRIRIVGAVVAATLVAAPLAAADQQDMGHGGATAEPGQMVPVPGEPGTEVDRRMLRDAVALDKACGLDYGDGYAESGHAANGEHPLGLALDIDPDAQNDAGWDRVDKLAAWAHAHEDGNPFYWVGYDGDSGHGRTEHLHLSWDHGPGGGVARVALLTDPQIKEIQRACGLLPSPAEVRAAGEELMDDLSNGAMLNAVP